VSADYFLEIESHFAARRGTPFIVNAKDWALMQKWSADGIPLPVVIEAIDSVFDKNEAKGARKVISSLSYCRHAVKELWQERKDLQVGAQDSVPEEDVLQRLEALAAEVERVAPAFGGRIRELSAEKSVPRVEERLLDLEEELVLSLVTEELRAEAQALARGADEKTRVRTEQAHLRRLTRERYGLPRLTVF
jgi:hypothetical protein